MDSIDGPRRTSVPPTVKIPTMEREGALLIGFGCLPFAAGAVFPASGPDFLPACPFRAMTGLPCPTCGATRAFTHVARGDAAFVNYNAFWVLVAVAMIVAGVAVAIKRRPIMDDLTRTPARAAVTLVMLGAAGWAYALAARETIAPA